MVCVYSSNIAGATVATQNQTCSDDVKFCMQADVKYKGVEMKYQACNNILSPDIPGLPKNCSSTGTTTMDATDLTGQYYCCDSSLCNTKSLNPDDTNSAIKPFAFGFASLFVIIALLF
uniref:UPAR/Ly6 domain-containing protein n=1 Tax=Panagrolaimus davidi TaxID=227884 RepID=A0A914QC29_9BILA